MLQCTKTRCLSATFRSSALVDERRSDTRHKKIVPCDAGFKVERTSPQRVRNMSTIQMEAVLWISSLLTIGTAKSVELLVIEQKMTKALTRGLDQQVYAFATTILNPSEGGRTIYDVLCL